MSAVPSRPPWTDLHARLHQTLSQFKLLPARASVLVAVSGGQDSLCLGQLLIDLQPRWGWCLAIAHCDHGWREDLGMAAAVRQIAARWQLPYHCWSTVGLAETEVAARTWRYQSLAQMADTRNYQYVVTAHTQSDVAETLLYNLLRGAGSDGLSSLRPTRPLTTTVQLVRPLLNIQRSETADFCQQRQLPVWDDQYNYKMNYTRNRVRQRVIPLLEGQVNCQAVRHLSQTAEILQAEATYLQNLAMTCYQQALVAPGQLDRSILKTLPLALRRRVVRLFLQNHQITANFLAIEAVVSLIDAHQGCQTSSLQGGVVQVQQQYLQLKKRT